jgi:hypothetical protein
MVQRWMIGIGAALVVALASFAAAAGPRPVIFQYAPDALGPEEWTQVRAVLNEQFADLAAAVRANGDEMLDVELTTVAKADVDFDGVAELFVMLYRPDVVCFPDEGCRTAILTRFADNRPWRFLAAPVSILSEGPPRFYLREEVAGRTRTFFSSVDPLVEEPQPDERVPFVRGAGALMEEDWVAIRDSLAVPFPGLVRERSDLDVAQVNAHIGSATPEWIVTLRNGCAAGERCPTVAYAKVNGTWRPARLPEVSAVFVGEDGLPILFLRDETKFGWRSGYTAPTAQARRRIPFPDWGRYSMTAPMLADIDLMDDDTGEWLGTAGNAYTGAEFLRDSTLQQMALERWIDRVADPMAEAAGLWLFEGRVIDYGTEKVKVTRAGISAATVAEGNAPVLVFFGMLARTNYVLDRSRFSAGLVASFTVIADRLRQFQHAEPPR